LQKFNFGITKKKKKYDLTCAEIFFDAVVFDVEAIASSVSPFRPKLIMGHGLDEQAHVFALEAVAVTGMSVAVQKDDSNSDAGEKSSSEYLQRKAYSERIQKFQHHIQPKFFFSTHWKKFHMYLCFAVDCGESNLMLSYGIEPSWA